MQVIVVMCFILAGPLFLMKAFLAIFINKLNVLKDASAEAKLRTAIGHWIHAKEGAAKAFSTWKQVVTALTPSTPSPKTYDLTLDPKPLCLSPTKGFSTFGCRSPPSPWRETSRTRWPPSRSHHGER